MPVPMTPSLEQRTFVAASMCHTDKTKWTRLGLAWFAHLVHSFYPQVRVSDTTLPLLC